MVAGVVRPAVLLPPTANAWSDSERELVLRHEMAHLERHDLVWQALALAVRAVYWFQPLTWQSWQKLQAERECACDDIALNRGAQPTRFAAMLHKIATENRGKALPIGIAMAETNRLEERVARTLSENRPRNLLNDRQRIAGLILALACTLAITAVRPFSTRAVAAPTPAEDTNEKDSKFVMLPNELEGKIVTKEGAAISGAVVVVELIRFYGHGDDFEVIKRWATKSDSKGKYIVGLNGKIRQSANQFIQTFASAPGYTDSPTGWGQWVEKIAKRGHLKTLEMKPGRMVSGRVIGPDGKPVAGASIKKAAGWTPKIGVEGEYFPWWPANSTCDGEGRFEFGCPKDKDAIVSLIFFADGLAPTHRRLRDADALGDIQLKKGTAAQGVVLDRNGKPLSGVCVAASQAWTDEEIRNSSMIVGLDSATLTDKLGKFKLASNISKLALIRIAASARDEKARCVRGTLEPPIVEPRIINADESEGTVSLEIKEPARIVKVSGQARWPNGNPATGVEIRTAAHPASPEWFGGTPWLAITHSDDDGKYDVEFPADIRGAMVYALSLIHI